MFRLLQKGLALMTVALTEIDVVLAGLGYRGLGSRGLVIENTGHYDPVGRSRQVTLTNTSDPKGHPCYGGAHSTSSINSHKSVGVIQHSNRRTTLPALRDCLRPRNPSLSFHTRKRRLSFSQEAESCLIPNGEFHLT